MTKLNLSELLNGLTVYKPTHESDIQKAETTLQTTFAPDYRECLLQSGIISCYGHETTGISDIQRLNVIQITQKQRGLNPQIPLDWYVIEELHIDNVVAWQTFDGTVRLTQNGRNLGKAADSLIEYLLS